MRHVFECALQMLSSSGAGGLVTVYCIAIPGWDRCRV